LYALSVLIDDTPVPGYDTASTVGVRTHGLNRGQGVDRVTEEDRQMERPFKDGKEGEGIDARRLTYETGGNRKAQQPMGHRPAKRV
jgi:hypothetical protein